MGFLSSKKKDFVVSSDRVKSTYGNEIEKEESSTHIGKTVRIKGEVISKENMTVEGWIKGNININKTLTIEREGRIKADIEANSIHIKGRVKGKIIAVDKIVILDNGICEGDINTDKLIVKEGAILLGNVNLDNETSKEITREKEINDQKPEVKDEIVNEDETEVIEGEVIEKDEIVDENVKDTTDEVLTSNNITEKKNKRKSKNKKSKKKS